MSVDVLSVASLVVDSVAALSSVAVVVAVVASVVLLESSSLPQPAASSPTAKTPTTSRIRWFFRILPSNGCPMFPTGIG